jgi:hypothetical protein
VTFWGVELPTGKVFLEAPRDDCFVIADLIVYFGKLFDTAIGVNDHLERHGACACFGAAILVNQFETR